MEPFKNRFSLETAKRISEALSRAYPGFLKRRFLHNIGSALEPLELKPRMLLLADRVESAVPLKIEALFSVLTAALSSGDEDPIGLRGFEVWPLTEVVARRGLNHFPASMKALREMTMRFTAEFAIRPFLRAHPDRTLKCLMRWTVDPSEHVRRLVSEGSRPLLPWGEHLPFIVCNPQLTLVLLEKLYRDPSEYVRRSVANHLNDFSKKHSALVIETLHRWRKKSSVDDANFAQLSRHACRTLLKSGHPNALKFHGFNPAAELELTEFTLLDINVQIGGELRFTVSVRNASKKTCAVLFDYAMHHCKSNGTTTAKVFNGRKFNLAAGETKNIEGAHSFRPVTTRKYYSGTHRMEIFLNGRSRMSKAFHLSV